jgi:hypothetical protein
MKMEYILMAIAFVLAGVTPYILKRRQQIKTGIPDADERVRLRFSKISLNISSVIGSLGVIVLAILTLMGREVIEISYIWFYLLLFILSLSIGAIISKR